MKKIVLFPLCIILSSVSLYTKEIKSSEGDGIVRHRDMILQDAMPGDYLYQDNGKTKRTLAQVDIDYSKKEYEKILKSLLDEKPGSIRAIIKEIVEDIGIDMPYPESEPETVDIKYLDRLSGRGVIEYVSSVNNRKQIITVIVRKPADMAYFKDNYKTPPWSGKTLSDGEPSVVVFAKKVNSNQNVCMSFNENIEETKRRLLEIRLTTGKVVASQKYGPAMYIEWDKNKTANKYKVFIRDKNHKLIDSYTTNNTWSIYYTPKDDFKYPAYISVAAMKDDISGAPSKEVKVSKPKKPIDMKEAWWGINAGWQLYLWDSTLRGVKIKTGAEFGIKHFSIGGSFVIPFLPDSTGFDFSFGGDFFTGYSWYLKFDEFDKWISFLKASVDAGVTFYTNDINLEVPVIPYLQLRGTLSAMTLELKLEMPVINGKIVPQFGLGACLNFAFLIENPAWRRWR